MLVLTSRPVASHVKLRLFTSWKCFLFLFLVLCGTIDFFSLSSIYNMLIFHFCSGLDKRPNLLRTSDSELGPTLGKHMNLRSNLTEYQQTWGNKGKRHEIVSSEPLHSDPQRSFPQILPPTCIYRSYLRRTGTCTFHIFSYTCQLFAIRVFQIQPHPRYSQKGVTPTLNLVSSLV